MKVDNVDERDIRAAEREATFVVFVYEEQARGPSTDVFVLREAVFAEVMEWVADRVSAREGSRWALAVLTAGDEELVWIQGGDPHVAPDDLDPSERRRIAEMERVGTQVFRAT